jgi:glucose/arabinose dehydrogenase
LVIAVAAAVMTAAAVAPGSAVGHTADATTTTTLVPPNISLPNAPTPTLPALPAPNSSSIPHAGLTPNLSIVSVRATPVATLVEPTAMAVRPDDKETYVAERTGLVQTLAGAVALDLTGQVSLTTEQGLVGLAIAPDSKHFYIDYTDLSNTIHVVEYAFKGAVADLLTRREVLTIPHASPLHNGGDLVFGPDGMLWISVGDGGTVGDAADNAQRLDTLLGKILRINPRPVGTKPYTVPPTNPFVNKKGARPEIWAYGLRNPWRFSFDAVTNDLWIADVAQDHWESVKFHLGHTPGGQNYGWSRMEGTHPYYGQRPANWTPPIYEYDHLNGACAIMGGYVYRGTRIQGLDGAYIFGDFCRGNVTALQQTAGRATATKDLGLSLPGLISFGQDANHELYALTYAGVIYRLDPA